MNFDFTSTDRRRVGEICVTYALLCDPTISCRSKALGQRCSRQIIETLTTERFQIYPPRARARARTARLAVVLVDLPPF